MIASLPPSSPVLGRPSPTSTVLFFLGGRPEKSYFKDLIKMSKSKLHIGLVRNAKYVKIDLKENILALLRVEANFKHKAFYEKSDIPPQEYNIDQKDFAKFGEKIRAMIK
ncbi:MAG: hypothetical protein H6570_01470 [Lewinellaceae bacterium]|nr:hypothetical protein [Lewinellaceae bacterium]